MKTQNGSYLRRLFVLTCFTLTCIEPGTVFSAQCTPEQIIALLDKGFSKDEAKQFCEPENKDQSQQPVEAEQTGTPDVDIDWSPLQKYFEISKVNFGVGEILGIQHLGELSRFEFIIEAKRNISPRVIPGWVTFYDDDNIVVNTSLFKCMPMPVLSVIQQGGRLRCMFMFDPSKDPTAKKIVFTNQPRGGQKLPSTGSSTARGDDDCSRCDKYQTRESLCGKDCSYMNAYTPGASDAMDECFERAQKCRADANQAYERCQDQCEQR